MKMKVTKANCGASVKAAMGGYMKAHKSPFGKPAPEAEAPMYSKGGYSKKKAVKK